MEQYQDTLIDLSQAIAQRPDDARVLAHRGETYRLLGRYQEALADFDRTIELKPNYAWAIAHRGETYRLLERYQEALADFDRTNELKPNYAWALAHRGETYYLLERYQEALADFDRTIELKPDYVWVLAHRGTIYELKGCYQEALADFDRAIELKPDYAWGFARRGLTYIAMRCYEEALTDLEQAHALDGTILNPWPGERGQVLNFLGLYIETIACCKQGLETNPDDHIALYSFVVAKARLQGLDEVWEDINSVRVLLQAILQTATNKASRACALYRLGGLAALRGEMNQAIHYLQEAISLDNQPLRLARHDPAWLELRTDPSFQALIAETIFEKQGC